MQGAQDQQALEVRRERTEQGQQGEAADGEEREAAQGKGHRTPGRECHGGDLGGFVEHGQPGAFVMANGECAAHIGHGDLGDMTIETGGERGEQHAEQAYHDARAERLGGGGCGWRRLAERGGERSHRDLASARVGKHGMGGNSSDFRRSLGASR